MACAERQKESRNRCRNSLHDDEYKQILEQKMVRRPFFCLSLKEKRDDQNSIKNFDRPIIMV